MDSNTRTTIANRSRDYFDIMRTAMFVLLGTLAIIIFGDTTGAELAIAVMIVATGLYAVLAGDDALRGLDALRADLNDEDKTTNFGKSLQTAPFLLFRAVSALSYVSIVIAELMTLY